MKHYGYHKVKCISKGLGYEITEAHGDEMYPEVHTLADANLRLERCGGTMLPKKPLGPP